MKCMLIFIAICLSAVIIVRHYQGEVQPYQFMSKAHTNIFRGLAAFIIVFQHVGGGFGTRVFTPLGGTGVAMFLIASGYGLNESYKRRLLKKTSGGGYWKNKLLRVFLPYALFEIAFIWYYDEFSVAAYLMDITCLKPHYWYLGILLIEYIAFWIVSLNAKTYQNRYWILGTVGILIFIFGGALYAEQAASFLVGVMISDCYEKCKEISESKASTLGLALIGIVLLASKQFPFMRVYEGTHIWFLIQMIMKLSLALFLVFISSSWQKVFNNRLLETAGIMSLEIYLVHIKALDIFQLGLPNVIAIILFIVCSVVGTWLLHQFIVRFSKRFA